MLHFTLAKKWPARFELATNVTHHASTETQPLCTFIAYVNNKTQRGVTRWTHSREKRAEAN